MPTTADILANTADRHTTYLLRWSQGTYNRHLHLIEEAIADLTYKLGVRGPADDSFTANRMRAMLKESDKTSKELYIALSEAVDGDYRLLSEYEAKFHINAIQSSYPIEMKLNAVTPAQIHSAAMAQPFQGKVLRDWWRSQDAGTRDIFKRQIRLGFVEGESLSQVAARLRGVGDKTKREVNTIIRTATAHYSQQASNKVTQANEDIFGGEKLIVTFDGRTSAICIRHGADDKLYPVGKGPIPPFHFGCRTTRRPVTKSWNELGFGDLGEDDKLSTRPFVADTRRVKDIPKSQRSQVIGRTTADNWDEFLEGQSDSFIPTALGRRRMELYQTGEITLTDLIRRDGSMLTLDQIEASENKSLQAAWRTAFGSNGN